MLQSKMSELHRHNQLTLTLYKSLLSYPFSLPPLAVTLQSRNSFLDCFWLLVYLPSFHPWIWLRKIFLLVFWTVIKSFICFINNLFSLVGRYLVLINSSTISSASPIPVMRPPKEITLAFKSRLAATAP